MESDPVTEASHAFICIYHPLYESTTSNENELGLNSLRSRLDDAFHDFQKEQYLAAREQTSANGSQERLVSRIEGIMQMVAKKLPPNEVVIYQNLFDDLLQNRCPNERVLPKLLSPTRLQDHFSKIFLKPLSLDSFTFAAIRGGGRARLYLSDCQLDRSNPKIYYEIPVDASQTESHLAYDDYHGLLPGILHELIVHCGSKECAPDDRMSALIEAFDYLSHGWLNLYPVKLAELIRYRRLGSRNRFHQKASRRVGEALERRITQEARLGYADAEAVYYALKDSHFQEKARLRGLKLPRRFVKSLDLMLASDHFMQKILSAAILAVLEDGDSEKVKSALRAIAGVVDQGSHPGVFRENKTEPIIEFLSETKPSGSALIDLGKKLSPH